MTHSSLVALGALLFGAIAVVKGEVPLYGQCGGLTWSGDSACVSGAVCTYQNDYYWQCVTGTAATTTVKSSTTSKTTSTTTVKVTTTTKVTTTSTKTSTSAVPTTSAPGGGSGDSPSPTETASIGYASGVTGGKGGATTTVTSLDALTAALAGDSPAIVYISGTITGNTVVKVGSNKTVLGKKGSALVGVGLRIINVSNVIVRNVKISVVLAEAGDAIGIQASHGVWVDHVDLSSNRDHDKDYYDGLLDVTHGCYGITISYAWLHDHWKAVLVGHSDSNGSEDTALRVTLHHNFWQNLNSRMPSFRFGQGHVYNNYFLNDNDGINTRDEAQLLVENNVFSGVSKPLYSTDGGYANAIGNDFGEGANTALAGSLTGSQLGYSYTLDPTSSVVAKVTASAGATLNF